MAKVVVLCAMAALLALFGLGAGISDDVPAMVVAWALSGSCLLAAWIAYRSRFG